MGYVKIDDAILTSTLWMDRDARDVFITALLLARPRAFDEEMPALHVRSLEPSGLVVPPGEYGFAHVSGPGLVQQAVLPVDVGLEALERLCQPDPESRSQEFEGRRMARVNGGYVIFNFMRHREKDTSAASRKRRQRERDKAAAQPSPADDVTGGHAVTSRDVTQAVSSKHEALKTTTLVTDPPPPPAPVTRDGPKEVSYTAAFLKFWTAYPKKVGKGEAFRRWQALRCATLASEILAAVEDHKQTDQWRRGFIPNPATWLNQRRWEDEIDSQEPEEGLEDWERDYIARRKAGGES